MSRASWIWNIYWAQTYGIYLLGCTVIGLLSSYVSKNIPVGRDCCKGVAFVLQIHWLNLYFTVPVKQSHGASCWWLRTIWMWWWGNFRWIFQNIVCQIFFWADRESKVFQKAFTKSLTLDGFFGLMEERGMISSFMWYSTSSFLVHLDGTHVW